MKNILIIDDEYDFLELFEEFLVSHGFRVHCCSCARIAELVCDLSDFDLIICDIFMPTVNGLDFLKNIRPQYTTPVILMTGQGTGLPENKDIYLKMGANGFLKKPFDMDGALSLIQDLCRTRRLEVAAP